MNEQMINQQSTDRPDHNWLQALMLRDPGRWSSRLGALVSWLRMLGRGGRRRFGRAAAGVLAGASGIALLALLAGPLAPPVAAATITVDPSGSCQTLIDAIDAANTGGNVEGCVGSAGPDTIVMTFGASPFTYNSAYAGTYNALPIITSEITIESSDPSTSVTIERGALAGDFRLFEVSATGHLTLSQVVVRNGSTPSGQNGGAILVAAGGELTLDYSTVRESTSAKFGGGIYGGITSTITLIGSYVELNSASSGGGIYSYGTITGTNAVFDSNSVEEKGGAISVDTTSPRPTAVLNLKNSRFSGNSAKYGGAIYANDSIVTIAGWGVPGYGYYPSIFEGNTADYYAGAIYFGGSGNTFVVTIQDTNFLSNTATNYAGAVYINAEGDFTFDRTSFLYNVTQGSGGAMLVDDVDVDVTIVNSTFAGNAAIGNSGGAIKASQGTVTMTHVTLVGNGAQSGGGGIASSIDLTLEKSIVSGNISPGGAGREINGSVNSSNNLLGSSQSTNAEAFSGFTPSGTDTTATSDGTIPTAIYSIVGIPAAEAYYNYTYVLYLPDGSPAIDLISGPCDPAKDQAGHDRPSGTNCDAGAVEYYSGGGGGGGGGGDDTAVFVSTWTFGSVSTISGTLDYTQLDILAWDGDEWTKWFDGMDAGLNPDAYKPGSRWKHNINAMSISDTESSEVYMSFTQNDEPVPDIPGRVDGMDVVFWDGDEWELVFNGNLRNIGLNNKTQEKIDGLQVLSQAPAGSEFAGEDCEAYMLISTQGPGLVPKPGNIKPKNVLKFGGEDVLGFCATNLGANTTGFWELVVDGSALGVKRNNIESISMSEDSTTMYLTSKNQFSVDSAFGGHSMVYTFDMDTETFDGPVFTIYEAGMAQNTKLDALHVTGDPSEWMDQK